MLSGTGSNVSNPIPAGKIFVITDLVFQGIGTGTDTYLLDVEIWGGSIGGTLAAAFSFITAPNEIKELHFASGIAFASGTTQFVFDSLSGGAGVLVSGYLVPPASQAARIR